jgi:septal ring-binding cell division protein DamX
VANKQGKQVSIKPDADPELKNRAPLAIGTLLVILIALGTSYLYWTQEIIDDDILPPITEKTITIISDNEDVVAINYPDAGQSTPAAETRESATSPQIVEQKQEGQSASEPLEQAIANNVSKEKLPLEVEPTRLEPPSAKADASEELVVYNGKQQLSRFQRDLDNALYWIEGQDKKKATIQVMTISSWDFDANAYYSYLETLVSKNIDVSKFRVYQTSIDDSVVFGVIYGEYTNLREANQVIQQLPETLKARAPVPRTFGGIWNEINNR